MDKYLLETINHTGNGWPTGIQQLYKFPNGYGASVVRNQFSYGNENGLWEVAMIKFTDDGKFFLVYDNDKFNDVVGHLTQDGIEECLRYIKDKAPDSIQVEKING